MNKSKLKVRNPDFIPDATIDFHQYTKLDKLDVEFILNNFIAESFINGFKTILIITGKGKFVREWTKAFLKSREAKYIKSFKIASLENGGDGAFEASLVD